MENKQKNTALDIGVSKTVKEDALNDKVKSLLINYNSIPLEMKEYPNWLVRIGKIPYSPRTARQGNSLEACGTYDQAITAIMTGQYDGLGFHFDNTPFTGIDLDHHIVNGAFDEMALNVFMECNSYCEYSPSGTGVHIIVKGEISKSLKNSKEGIELYSEGRYFTVTGDMVPNSPSTVAYRQGVIDGLYSMYRSNKSTVKVVKGERLINNIEDLKALEIEYLPLIDKMRTHDNTGKFTMLFDAGELGAFNGDASSADMSLLNILAFWTKRDPQKMHDLFCLSALANRKKWQEGNGQEPMYYRELSIYKAIAYQERLDKKAEEELKNSICEWL